MEPRDHRCGRGLPRTVGPPLAGVPPPVWLRGVVDRVTNDGAGSSPLLMNTAELENRTTSFRLSSAELLGPAQQPLLALQDVVNNSELEPALVELVKIRASQINRCAFCIDMHIQDARRRGERPDRVYLLPAWEEVGLYSDRERAALRWAEAVTLVAGGVDETTFAQAKEQFTEKELVELTLVVIAINAWNRLNVPFRVPPGGK